MAVCPGPCPASTPFPGIPCSGQSQAKGGPAHWTPDLGEPPHPRWPRGHGLGPGREEPAEPRCSPGASSLLGDGQVRVLKGCSPRPPPMGVFSVQARSCRGGRPPCGPGLGVGQSQHKRHRWPPSLDTALQWTLPQGSKLDLLFQGQSPEPSRRGGVSSGWMCCWQNRSVVDPVVMMAEAKLLHSGGKSLPKRWGFVGEQWSWSVTWAPSLCRGSWAST